MENLLLKEQKWQNIVKTHKKGNWKVFKVFNFTQNNFY